MSSERFCKFDCTTERFVSMLEGKQVVYDLCWHLITLLKLRAMSLSLLCFTTSKCASLTQFCPLVTRNQVWWDRLGLDKLPASGMMWLSGACTDNLQEPACISMLAYWLCSLSNLELSFLHNSGSSGGLKYRCCHIIWEFSCQSCTCFGLWLSAANKTTKALAGLWWTRMTAACCRPDLPPEWLIHRKATLGTCKTW